MRRGGLEFALRGRCGPLLLDVALRIDAGWTVLFGPSGSGKSTVLRMIAGLDRPEQGRVVVEGTTVLDTASRVWVPPHRRRVRMVAQRPGLFPGRSVRSNVAFGASDAARLREAVELCRIGDLLPRSVRQLSGGERQRVALARSLAADDPCCLLLDEPFTGLDLRARDSLLGAVQRWPRLEGVPVVFVTHDISEALSCGKRLVRLSEGQVIADGLAGDVLSAERENLRQRLDDSMQHA